MKKSIAFIGSNSFSGYHLIKLCKESNYKVYGISRYDTDRIKCDKHLKADINKDSYKIKEFLNELDPDVIVNIVAIASVQTSWEHPGDYFRTNCASISDIVKGISPKKFIQMSTPEVYGNKIGGESTLYNPSTPYAMSKAAFDMYLMSLYKNYNFPVSFVRPCNWFGPYQNLYTIVPKTIIKIKKKEKLYLDGTGLSYRNFIYVTNVCDGILKVIENGKEGEIYHISTDDLLSIKELIELICMKMGYSFNKLIVERPDRIGKDMEYNLDSNKIRKDLGWKPRYTLSEGIDKTIEWIENDWDKLKNMSLEYNFRN